MTGTIGSRVRTAREELGLTQQDVARATKIMQSVISRIETNERATSPTEVSVLARCLGTTPGYLRAESEVRDQLACAGRGNSGSMFETMAFYFELSDQLDHMGFAAS